MSPLNKARLIIFPSIVGVAVLLVFAVTHDWSSYQKIPYSGTYNFTTPPPSPNNKTITINLIQDISYDDIKRKIFNATVLAGHHEDETFNTSLLVGYNNTMQEVMYYYPQLCDDRVIWNQTNPIRIQDLTSNYSLAHGSITVFNKDSVEELAPTGVCKHVETPSVGSIVQIANLTADYLCHYEVNYFDGYNAMYPSTYDITKLPNPEHYKIKFGDMSCKTKYESNLELWNR